MVSNNDRHQSSQTQGLGEFIKSQRRLEQMSIRELAKRTEISNPYLSQIERGLHEPSVRVLKAISKALNLSLSSLLSHLEPFEDSAGTSNADVNQSQVELAIGSDPLLSTHHKEALLASYRTFVSASDHPKSTTHKKHDQRRPSKKSKSKAHKLKLAKLHKPEE